MAQRNSGSRGKYFLACEGEEEEKGRKRGREGNEPGENEGGREREAKVRQRIGDTESQICDDECENGNRNSHREGKKK